MNKEKGNFKNRNAGPIAFLKNIHPKHWLILAFFVAILVILGFSIFKVSANNTYYDTITLSNSYTNEYLLDAYGAPLYSKVLEQYDAEGLVPSGYLGTVPTSAIQGAEVSASDPQYGAYVDDYADFSGASGDVHLIDSENSATFTYGGTASGLFYLAFDFRDLTDTIANTQYFVEINHETPFYEARTLTVPAEWIFDTTTFTLDRYGNEIQPGSYKAKQWQYHEIDDQNGLHPGLFAFHLEPGDEITIGYVNAEFLLGQVYFVNQEAIPSYSEYQASHPQAEVVEKTYMVSARDMLMRGDPSIRLRSEQDPSNMYYDTKSLMLNVIFGDSWRNSGQSVTYAIDVETSGYYHLTFKYRQYAMQDMASFRKIMIDGTVPFDLLECYAFPYTTNFLNRTLTDAAGDALDIYLEAGSHTITMEAVNYPYRDAIESIQFAMNKIQSIALSVKKYTSGGTDRYRDWEIETYFPNARSDIESLSSMLDDLYQSLLSLSGKNQPAAIANLRVAANRLRSIAADINALPSLMVQFSDGDSSVNQILGNLMQQMMRSSLELERTIVHGDVKIPKAHANAVVRLWEGTKRLVLSFIDNPYASQGAKSGELVVWVNHPRQYIEIMQHLIDADYDSNIKVTLSQMPDQNKLILANASGTAPDVVLGVDNWIPYDYAIRSAALDLRQFSGYEELVAKFSRGAMIPYAFEEGMFALPETQNFWVTYYRKDILESIGIDHVPQTWDEIIDILPILQSYGMNYFIPLSQYSGLKPFVATIPFIYQYGGNLYTDNGMETAINSDATLKGITMMSDLYTLYNIPKYVGSFFNNFRYGTLPIGISDLSTYLLLETSAVELDGLWGIDLHPGVYDETADKVVRYAAVGAQASMIMSSTEYPAEAWDFLSWWMSTPTQSDFAFLLQSTYGQTYFWNTANLEAFQTLSMPKRDKDVILVQWDYAIEASRIPGAYMVEREISNAWTQIVFDGANPRQALDEAVRVSNREIMYKMAEFGYTLNGEIVKDYLVPTIYNIDYWLTEVTGDE